jgi:predicted nucleotidyltransferase
MFETLISRIAKELDRSGLPYMIIGGQAVLFYGTPRMTKDIDITLGIDTASLDLVVQAIKSIGIEIIPDDFRAFAERTCVLPTIEKESGLRIDFIFSFTPYERQAIERAKPVLLGETKVMFASVEDVIIHKVFAGRPRDLEDVRSVMIKNTDFDRDYVRKWLKDFEKSSEKGGLLGVFEEILAGIIS